MESVALPHLQQFPLHVGLFIDVQNVQSLRGQLLAGNAAFEYAFLDAAMIFDRQHLLAACFKAINDMGHGRLRTRNVHSEIVFALSPNNNIAESFKRFGLSNETKDVVAIKVATSARTEAATVAAHLTQNVHGELVGLSDTRLGELRDLSRLRKVYRLTLPGKADDGQPSAAQEAYMSSIIVGTMALKGT